MKRIAVRSINTLIILSFITSLSACRKEQGDAPPAQAVVADDANQDQQNCEEPRTLVTYAQDIKPILDQYCVSCHSQAAGAAKGLPPTSFADYESARNWGYLMPGFRLFAELDAADQQAIQDWISGGLTEADYLGGVKDILDTNCVTCHDADAPQRKDLPNSNFEDPAIVKLFGSQFPPFGELKGLPEDQQGLIEQWIKDGLPLE